MKNRVLMMAAMAGLVAPISGPSIIAGGGRVVTPQELQRRGPSGMTFGQMVERLVGIQQSSGNWYGMSDPAYPRRGWSVAEGKRRARKARDRLRAKGKHRRAVR